MENILNQLTSLDERQLLELNTAVCKHIKFLRAAKTRAVKASLSEGDNVCWVGKSGLKHGKVTSIKRKFAHVAATDGSGLWRVPMSILTQNRERLQ